MGKSFPDPGDYAHVPPDQDVAHMPAVIKVIPTVPASQSDRPQLRPITPTEE